MDKIVIGDNIINTLVAITEDDHIVGLMYKPWPPPIMTFPYKTAGIRKFWMRNTISPLDIIFCCADKILSIHQGKPFSLDYIGPDEPSDMVIEMPQGLSRTLHISIGQNVILRPSLKTMAAIYSNSLKLKS